MNQRVVVDTDVVSYLFKNDSRAKLYKPYLDRKQCIVSFVTVAELYFWASKKEWNQNRIAALEQHLQKFVVYPVDLTLCKKWAEVTLSIKKKGRVIAPNDAWIAATALAEGIPLISNNNKDYIAVDGLELISVDASVKHPG